MQSVQVRALVSQRVQSKRYYHTLRPPPQPKIGMQHGTYSVHAAQVLQWQLDMHTMRSLHLPTTGLLTGA